MEDFRIEKNKLTVQEYQTLRHTTDWFQLDDETVGKSLESDLFSICIYSGDLIIGMGRIVGDGAIYFYIQDIIVVPEMQGKGIGKMIMDEIEDYLQKNAFHNSFVGLMAASGVEKFYHQFGYKTRDADKPGMSKLIKKNGVG